MLASHSLFYKWLLQEVSTSRAENQNSIHSNREVWTVEERRDLWRYDSQNCFQTLSIKSQANVPAWVSKKKTERFTDHKL